MKKVAKKIILLLVLVALTAPTAFAACEYMNRCAISPYSKTLNASQKFAEATGANSWVEGIVQNLLQTELKNLTNSDFQAKVKIFGTQEVLDGQFKSLMISGNNVEFQGIHFTALKIQTVCDFNHINITSKPITIKQNMVLAISAEISGADLRNTIEYKNYSNDVSKTNLTQLGISAFRIYSPTIIIRDNKLYFTINATPNNTNPPMDLAISADLKAMDGRMVTSRINYVNYNTGFDLTQIAGIAGTLNNLTYPLLLKNNQKGEVQIQNINIVGDKIFVNGFIFLPKNATF